MKKIHYVLVMLWVLYPVPSSAQVSIEVGLPHVSIGINLSVYPKLVIVPGYPVYYARDLDANFFFYDGAYWVFQDDNWYESSWYNGPWVLVEPEFVPVFILRIPVFYYRRPPAYFHGWRSDAPPRWGEHWGHDWERHRSGWDKWDHGVHHDPAPLPLYQRHYSGERYPRQVERQHELHRKNYHYQPRDPAVRQRSQAPTERITPVQPEINRIPEVRGSMPREIKRPVPHQPDESTSPRASSPSGGDTREQEAAPASPQQERPAVQYHRQQTQPGTARREQQIQRSQNRETGRQNGEFRQQDGEARQQAGDDGRASQRWHRRDEDRGRDR